MVVTDKLKEALPSKGEGKKIQEIRLYNSKRYTWLGQGWGGWCERVKKRRQLSCLLVMSSSKQ